MENDFKQTIGDNPYFQSLPAHVQETIMQGGVSVNNEEELKKCAEKLMGE